jgi:hypothetical protein
MSRVWTCHLGCCNCGKEFIVNRLALVEAYTAIALFPCPHCLKAPAAFTHHNMNYLYASKSPYRKISSGQTWHHSEYCSQWPVENFLEIEFTPEAEICNECKVLVGNA